MHVLGNQWVLSLHPEFAGANSTLASNFHVEIALRITASDNSRITIINIPASFIRKTSKMSILFTFALWSEGHRPSAIVDYYCSPLSICRKIFSRMWWTYWSDRRDSCRSGPSVPLDLSAEWPLATHDLQKQSMIRMHVQRWPNEWVRSDGELTE